MGGVTRGSREMEAGEVQPVPGRPPLTFAEAEQRNPFALLGELRDHAMALRVDEKPAEFHLTELALAAAVVAWWTRWQPIAMHRALVEIGIASCRERV